MDDSQKSFLKNLVHKDTVQFAIQSGNLQLLKSLIEKGAEIPDDSVSSAAAEGHLDIVKYLVDEKGIEVFHSFWYAAHNGHFPVMEYLFEKGVTISDNGDAVNYTFLRGNSSRLEVVKYLIEKGAKIDDESVSCAITDGGIISHASVKYLIDEKGAKISDGAVYEAVLEGSLRIVKYLVEKGAEINEGILSITANEGHFDIVKYLVDEKGENVNGEDSNGHSAISGAAENGHFEIVKYLIEKGAEIDDDVVSDAVEVVSSYRIKAIPYAAIHDHLNIVKLFEIVKFLEEEGLSRCEALAIYNKIEAGELKFPE
jgi:ankyrin repeat protein